MKSGEVDREKGSGAELRSVLPPRLDGSARVSSFTDAVQPHTRYEVARIDASGNTAVQVLRLRQLLSQTGLSAQEMRRVDPTLVHSSKEPSLVVSTSSIVVNLGDGVRVLVFNDHALVFEPVRWMAKSLLERLSARIAAASLPRRPFELEVVEAALQEVTMQLDALLVDATSRVQELQRVLPLRLQITAEVLEELSAVKQSLAELEGRAHALHLLLVRVLDDEEDVRGMLLTLKGHSTADLNEDDAEDLVEDLLLHYLRRVEHCHGKAEMQSAFAKDLEKFFSTLLQSRKFEVNKLQLFLLIVSFGVALGGMLAGIMGMNLRNRMEESTAAFYLITLTILLLVALISGVIIEHMRAIQVL